MRPRFLFVALCAAALPGQTFTLPTLGIGSNTNLPFAAGIGRYQQWFSAAQVAQGLSEPSRITRMEFFAGSLGTVATTLDVEFSMGHGGINGLSSTFDLSYAGPRTVVLPRTTLNLAAAGSGGVALVVNFTERFTWDGRSPILFEVKVFGNGRNNQTFTSDFLSVPTSGFIQSRSYAGNNASAPSGAVTPGQGLQVRFTYRPGAVVAFGSGCPSSNFVTPVATVQGVPSPGIVWTHIVSSAAAQQLCALVMGVSRTQWNGVPLPLDLGPVLSAAGCSLLVSGDVTFFAQTVGAASAGSATVPISLPPVTNYIGLSLFTQWLVADPAALNGVLTATGAHWSIVAPVGG